MSVFPNVALPSFEVDLPSNPNIKYRFRPFLVKEEKLLLLLDDTSTAAEVQNLTMDLIKRCCLNEVFNYDALSYFDIEFLFLALRARSVGETQDVVYECNNINDEAVRCGNRVTIKVDFTKMEVMPNNYSTVVSLDGGITLEMQFPTQETVRQFESAMHGDGVPTQAEIYETSLDFVSSLIMKIINANGAIKRGTDFSQQGCKEWVEGLTHQDFAKLQAFVTGMPKVVLRVPFECGKCGHTEEMVLEGLQSFFE